MNSFRGYGAFSYILILGIFVHAQMINTVSGSMKDILGNVTELCADIESLPDTLCSRVVTGVKNEMDKICDKTVDGVCGLISFPFNLLFSEHACEEKLTDSICKLDDDFLNYVGGKCVRELQRLWIGPHCNSDGKAIDLCRHMPTTAGDICTFVVDTGCDKLPPLLRFVFSDLCQDAFGVVCSGIDKLVG